MPTVQVSVNGLTVGTAGGLQPCARTSGSGQLFDAAWKSRECCRRALCECRDAERTLCCNHLPAKRGDSLGWTDTSSRNNTRFLRSVHTGLLTGDGYAVTLTVRNLPESSAAYVRAVDLFLRRLKHAGMIRSHRVLELTRRRRPHTHGSFYFPEGWLPPGTDITYKDGGRVVREAIVKAWMIAQWQAVAGQWGTGFAAQDCKAIDGAVGWLQYVSKHAARGSKMYQRVGTVPGWDVMPRVWSKTGGWPVREPVRFVLDLEQGHRFRRQVQRYEVAQRRKDALRYEAAGQHEKAASAWRSVAYLRRSRKCGEPRLSAVRGVSEWIPEGDALQLAYGIGWRGEVIS